jgi:hypothetical protein|tara:strand:- start:607 stop:1062 length:456 start_codon:yes stop_codon:yes gene_type:complete
MAHFTKIDENNKVLKVLAFNDFDMLNADGVEDESVGQQYLQKHHNWPSHLWIQTSYNTSGNKHSSGDNSKAFRGNYAGVGYTWDLENQIFWHVKPYPSWVKNITEAIWQSPIGDAPNLPEEQESQNTSGTHAWYYIWNEENQTWELTDREL